MRSSRYPSLRCLGSLPKIYSDCFEHALKSGAIADLGQVVASIPNVIERGNSLSSLRPPSIDASWARRALREDNAAPFDLRNLPILQGRLGKPEPERKRRPGKISDSAVSAFLLKTAMKIVQALAGAALIFALDRTLLASSRAAGLKIPTAPAGMLLVFFGMMAVDAVSPKTAAQILGWFAPARKFYRSGPIPLFCNVPF